MDLVAVDQYLNNPVRYMSDLLNMVFKIYTYKIVEYVLQKISDTITHTENNLLNDLEEWCKLLGENDYDDGFKLSYFLTYLSEPHKYNNLKSIKNKNNLKQKTHSFDYFKILKDVNHLFNGYIVQDPVYFFNALSKNL